MARSEPGSPAQHRLAVEELLAHHLSMRLLYRRQQRRSAPAMNQSSEQERRFLAGLPFKLTGAQQRVISEISADLAKQQPMLRLLQAT